LYGTIDPATGEATPHRVSPRFGVVDEIRNSRGDRAVSAGAQLQKRFGEGGGVSLAYAYTDARDRLSANCFSISCNIDFTPLDGTLRDRRITTSRFEARHKITIAAVANLPFRLRLGLSYNGFTGQPYTYLITGDANASGSSTQVFEGDDIVYVPWSADDITLRDPALWQPLDSIIRSDRCLGSRRGTILRRNSCRNPWKGLLNLRLSETVPVGGSHVVELIADMFNLPNFLDRAWGVRRAGSLAGDVQLLTLVGYDQARQRGIYDVIRPGRDSRDDDATRWRLQLGARYTF